MTELPIQRLLHEVIDVLESCKVPYVIMGGFAVRTWGVARPTYDADMAVALDETQVTAWTVVELWLGRWPAPH